MHPYFYRDLVVGVLGGGQLGRMLIQAAIDYNLTIHVLDPDDSAPCKPYSHSFTQGSLTDYDTVYQFGQSVDVLTIEIENVNTEALETLQSEGKKVFPDPKTIRMIQDKRLQKQFFADHEIPTAPFQMVKGKSEVRKLSAMFPAVYKLGKAGYDGRGVQIIKTTSDLDEAFDGPGILESLIPFEKELAIIVSRNQQGEVVTFPLVEMVFHPVHNLVEYLFAPANVTPEIVTKAQELATRLVNQLEYVGVIAIELFLTKSGEILVNELAPRPHNSGHHTIRANATSQYEQHVRAILGLPLGDTRQLSVSAMVNLLGASGHVGKVVYAGIEDILAMPRVYPHIYGKALTRPQRKMGHVTLLANTREELLERIKELKTKIEVRGERSQG